jgi:hypothetical protein
LERIELSKNASKEGVKLGQFAVQQCSNLAGYLERFQLAVSHRKLELRLKWKKISLKSQKRFFQTETGDGLNFSETSESFGRPKGTV